MKHYVYRTINLITNREYIGARSHPNPEVDSYLGSGVEIVKDIKILGINSFKKEILQVFSSRDEAELFETQLVSKEYLENTFTYNIALYGKNTKSFKRVKDKVWKEYDAIRDKYKSGLSCNIISKKYNCSPSTIKNIVKDIIRTPKEAVSLALKNSKSNHRNKKIDKNIKHIIELYQKGYSILYISKMFNISSDGIRNRLKENNIELRSFKESRKNKKEYSKKEVWNHYKEILYLKNKGNTLKEIGKKFNCDPHTISRILKSKT